MIRPALRIASATGIPGTAGLIAEGASGPVLVTSSHVVRGEGARSGDVVWAIPNGKERPVPLGRAGAGVLGRVSFAGETVFVDAALVELQGPPPAWLDARLAALAADSVGAAGAGLPVTKSGASTGYAEGVVLDAAYHDFPFVDGRQWDAPGQILVQSRDNALVFSGPGDSGAGLVDDTGRLVGLLWGATEHGHGIACPIEPALDHLGVLPCPGALRPVA